MAALGNRQNIRSYKLVNRNHQAANAASPVAKNGGEFQIDRIIRYAYFCEKQIVSSVEPLKQIVCRSGH
jgi:hypothetical protein